MRVRPYTHIPTALGAFVLATLVTTTANAASPSPLGVWYDHDGRGAVEIKQCGSKLCGRLVWAKSAKDAKRGCGKLIIKNVSKVASNTWDNGRIYSPEKGQSYDVELKPISDTKLRVVGYLGTKLFSQTFIWRRAPANLERCDSQNAPIEAKKKTAPPATPKMVAKKQAPPPPAALGAPPKKIAKTPVEKAPKTTTTAKIDDTPPDVIAPKPSRAERLERAPSDSARNDEYRGTKEAPKNSDDNRNDEVARADDNNNDDDFGPEDDFENDDDNDSGSKRDMCRLEVPFVTISFPCKK